jgi:hypothetical protein
MLHQGVAVASQAFGQPGEFTEMIVDAALQGGELAFTLGEKPSQLLCSPGAGIQQVVPQGTDSDPGD